MESRSSNLEGQKDKVLSYIEINGPTLPMKVANYLKVDSIIVSAFLSELLGEKKLKMSSMKVGNSPLYFIRGQEFQLEKFINYLGGKEREAFELLNEHKILLDEIMLPPIRVALRSIKDFAFPFEHNGKIYWRYMKFPQDMALEMIMSKQQISVEREIKTPILERIKQVVMPHKEILLEPQKPLIERGIETNYQEQPIRVKGIEIEKPRTEFIEFKEEKKIETIFESPVEIIKPQVKRAQRVIKSKFLDSVNLFLEKENIEVVEVLKKGKKDYLAVISHSDEGSEKKNYLCIVKDKKTVSDKELMKNLQEGKKRGLPVLFVSYGDASKKAIEWLDYLGNLIIYKKMD